MEHAHQDVRRTRRVGERAEDIEDGAHAHFATYRRHHLHGRVMHRCVHEADAGLRQRGGDLFGLQFDHCAQCFQRVGTAGLGRDTAVAVLGDLGTTGGGHEHRAGGNVEGVRAIAAGADDIHHVLAVAHFHAARELAHHRGCTGDFADGLLLDPQPGEDGGNHHVGDLAAHDLPHQLDHFVVKDFAVFDGALQGFLRRDGHG